MFTPWKSLAAVVAAAFLTPMPAQAGDHFRLAMNGGGHSRQGSFGGYGYCPNPWRCYPGLNIGIGMPFPVPDYAYAPPPALTINAPPVYYYTTPNYPAPGGLGVVTYSTPNGAATYSVTQPIAAAGGAEIVQPPVPRTTPMSAPGHFHIAPLNEIRASVPAGAPRPGESRIGNSLADRATIRIEKK